MSESVIERIASLLDQAAKSDGNVVVPALAILWPDKERQWESAVQPLRDRRRFLTLGSHEPNAGIGPAYWLRCVVANAIEFNGPDGLPVIYLPGVTREDLRSVAASDQRLAPLASLQHQSQWFTQSNGRDWTIRAFLTNKDRGLGLSVASDDSTSKALAAGLNQLVRQPISRLADRFIDAAFLNGMLNPDPVRLLLRWINDPSATQQDLSGIGWEAFIAQCKSDFGFEPTTASVLEAAGKLGEGEGVWEQVWQRFRESPTDYPGIPERLRAAKPLELFTPSSLAWPQDNEAAEDQLRAQLLDLQALTPSGASSEIAMLEESHRPRRGSVWSQLGQSPLALAVEHLAHVAATCSSQVSSGTVEQIRQGYASHGWQTDLAAIRALGEVHEARDVMAVGYALKAVYQPWLEANALALQNAVGPEANSGTYLGQVQGRGVRRRRVILRLRWFRRSVPRGCPPVRWGCR